MSSILDKGLDTIEKTDTRIDDDELGSSTLPMSTYEDQSHAYEEMCEEMQSLQAKLMNLESKICDKEAEPSPRLTRKSSTYSQKRLRSSSGRRPKSRSGSRDSRDRRDKIKSSEKSIKTLERRISQSPARNSNSSFNSRKPYENIKNELYAERRKNLQLEKELEVVKRKVSHKQALDKRYKLLEEDYRNLLISYERSEVIRKKQKSMIESLKGEMENLETRRHSKSKKKRTRY